MKIEHRYGEIDGWFDFSRLYKKMVEIHDEGSHFVEVGAWKGKSTSFMATEIANSGKIIAFDVVDTWDGSEEHKDPNDPFYEPLLLEKDGLYNKFIENMKGLEEYYNPIRTTSIGRAGAYADECLDFVLIDASHDYENVKADIEAWIPKVKRGGYLCGHDAKHPPIRRATDEKFGGNYSIDPTQDIWIFKKP